MPLVGHLPLWVLALGHAYSVARAAVLTALAGGVFLALAAVFVWAATEPPEPPVSLTPWRP